MRALIATTLATICTAVCQPPAYLSPQYPRLDATDARDLYQRLTSSDYVVTGIVTKIEGRGERLSDGERAKRLESQLGLGALKVGSLYTVAVEGPPCRGADFISGTPGTSDPGKQVHLFVSQEEGPLPSDGHHVEALAPGAGYLLFLRRDPQQTGMVEEYELDSDLTYYRTVDQNRGAIRLPNDTGKGQPGERVTAFVEAVAALCQAAEQENMTLKMGIFSALRFSANPAARDAAKAALSTLSSTEAGIKAP